jgi:hypothetical protein
MLAAGRWYKARADACCWKMVQGKGDAKKAGYYKNLRFFVVPGCFLGV